MSESAVELGISHLLVATLAGFLTDCEYSQAVRVERERDEECLRDFPDSVQIDDEYYALEAIYIFDTEEVGAQTWALQRGQSIEFGEIPVDDDPEVLLKNFKKRNHERLPTILNGSGIRAIKMSLGTVHSSQIKETACALEGQGAWLESVALRKPAKSPDQ